MPCSGIDIVLLVFCSLLLVAFLYNKGYFFSFLCISHDNRSFNTYYMKKSLLLLTVLFFSLVTFAQGFSYGVTAGLNVSQPKDYKNHLGFNVGVKGEYLFSDKIDCPYLETSLLLHARAGKMMSLHRKKRMPVRWTGSAMLIIWSFR